MTRVTQLIHDAGKYLLISVYPLPTHPTHNFTHNNGGNLETLPGWPKKFNHNRPARCAGQSDRLETPLRWASADPFAFVMLMSTSRCTARHSGACRCAPIDFAYPRGSRFQPKQGSDSSRRARDTAATMLHFVHAFLETSWRIGNETLSTL